MIFCFPRHDGGVTFPLFSKSWLEMIGEGVILAGEDIISGDDQGSDDSPGAICLHQHMRSPI